MSLYMTFEELADRVTSGDFPMDVNMEMEYKGFTIIVDSENGANPFMSSCTLAGRYPKVCIVPEGEYKWTDITFTIDDAKILIDKILIDGWKDTQ